MFKKYQFNHAWYNRQRHYFIEGNLYAGITTITSKTKPEIEVKRLAKWREEVGEEEANLIVKQSCQRGNKIHSQLENYFNHKPIITDSTINNYWQSLQTILPKIENIKLIEGCVWHPLLYAGKVDCVAEFEGNLTIIDWKTSEKPKQFNWIIDYKLQVSAYCAAVNRVYNTQINNGLIIIALPNQPAQIFRLNPEKMMYYWEKFQHRLEEYYQQFPSLPKKQKEKQLK